MWIYIEADRRQTTETDRKTDMTEVNRHLYKLRCLVV